MFKHFLIVFKWFLLFQAQKEVAKFRFRFLQEYRISDSSSVLPSQKNYANSKGNFFTCLISSQKK